MRRILLIVVIGMVLVAWDFKAFAEIPNNIQAVLDKQASGQSLTQAEQEIIHAYLGTDESKVQLTWGETDTQWGSDGFGYIAVDANSGGATFHW